ncbi:MAG: Ppx/GppA family phosphatase [Alphaproteobacteria bacterium]|nr:Ppx/GppA family phosphatase [Alphaproteobacteria bacterium]
MAEGKRRRRGPRRRRESAEKTGGGSAAVKARETSKDRETSRHASSAPRKRPPERYAALDLGTNNCRLLIAAPRGRGFRIVDAYSRIVRLGEGLASTGALSPVATARAMEALRICAEKVEKRGVTHIRCIATQACRAASNGRAFLDEVKAVTGLDFEIIPPEEEARLSVAGCGDLLDADAPAGLVFDIGGGSTEISWVRPKDGRAEMAAWHSMPVGVVNLSERWGGREMDLATYEAVVDAVREEIRAVGDPAGLREAFEQVGAHFLGTSGTVTSIAGVHLKLPRYRRDLVDGLWLTREDARAVTERLIAMDFAARASEPCIGVDRADLVVCGCAILEALLREWPVERIRVGDRGLREGVLADLARSARKERTQRRRG